MRILFTRTVSPETLRLLHRICNNSQYPRVRRRARFLILAHQGSSIGQLLDVFAVSRQTLRNWSKDWNDRGLPGLYSSNGRGRKRSLTLDQEECLVQWMHEEPNPSKLLKKIQETWGITISKRTLQRILKRMNSRMQCSMERYMQIVI